MHESGDNSDGQLLGVILAMLSELLTKGRSCGTENRRTDVAGRTWLYSL